MVYRPTVRYDDRFRDYVEDCFHATKLDRNQIIRLGLFLLPYSEEGANILRRHAVGPLPSPKWEIGEHGVWLVQNLDNREGGKDVTTDQVRDVRTNERPIGVHEEGISLHGQQRTSEELQGPIRPRTIERTSGGGLKIYI